jgi:hypothetical protein
MNFRAAAAAAALRVRRHVPAAATQNVRRPIFAEDSCISYSESTWVGAGILCIDPWPPLVAVTVVAPRKLCRVCMCVVLCCAEPLSFRTDIHCVRKVHFRRERRPTVHMHID